MLLTAKTKALLTHCHTLLTYAEEETEQGKGIPILDKGEEELLRQNGLSIVEYCERNGCTKEHLSSFSLRHKAMFKKFREYYEICIKSYTKNISSIGGEHIPILYAALMLQELRTNKLIGLDIDYNLLVESIKNSDHLKGVERESKFVKDKKIIDLEKFRSYNKCVHDAISQVMKKGRK